MHRILSGDLMNGATQEGLRAFSRRTAGAGLGSPGASRMLNGMTDILMWVQSGASISETARAFGLSRRYDWQGVEARKQPGWRRT